MSRRVVLIAEDDPSDALFLRKALQEICPATRVEEVRDGQQAIDYLAGNGQYADRRRYPMPDQVVLDVKMPRKTGLEVLQWIRSNDCKGLPAVVLSGSQLASDSERAQAMGASYFVKPVEYSALLQIARTICARMPGA